MNTPKDFTIGFKENYYFKKNTFYNITNLLTNFTIYFWKIFVVNNTKFYFSDTVDGSLLEYKFNLDEGILSDKNNFFNFILSRYFIPKTYKQKYWV